MIITFRSMSSFYYIGVTLVFTIFFAKKQLNTQSVHIFWITLL